MSNKKNIYQKLLEIQKAVKGLSKDKKSHNYEYVTGNKLLSFIRPLMDNYSLILKQEIISIQNDRQDYNVWDKWAVNKDGTKGNWKPKNEILSKVMMRFTWVDCETGEKDENLFGANGQNDWEKGLGSALTYAERYFLLKYFHIGTDEDDVDNPNRKESEKKEIKKPNQPTQQSKSKKSVSNLENLKKKLGGDKRLAVLKQLREEFELTEPQITSLNLTKEEAKGIAVVK